jgi:CubicO group peptidase (beta-lactamase class C family)
MEPARRQCIASITKTMVGLCAMALVDEGRLRLDAKVAGLLPDVAFDGPAGAMTVWHLMTHTSGIGEAQTAEWLADTVNPNADARRKPGNFASMYQGGVTVESEAGAKWAYANNGVNLLGEIVSRAEDGAELRDVLSRRIFGPLGMHDTDLLGQDHPELTTPYHRAPNDDTREQLTRAGIPIKDETPVDGVNIRGKFGGEFNKRRSRRAVCNQLCWT